MNTVSVTGLRLVTLLVWTGEENVRNPSETNWEVTYFPQLHTVKLECSYSKFPKVSV